VTTHTPTRDEAFALLKEFNQNESLLKHALAVEGVMRHAARKRGAVSYTHLTLPTSDLV